MDNIGSWINVKSIIMSRCAQSGDNVVYIYQDMYGAPLYILMISID